MKDTKRVDRNSNEKDSSKKYVKAATPIVVIILLISLLFSLCSCNVDSTHYLIGTVINFKIEGSKAASAEKEAVAFIKEVDKAVSTSRDDSCVSRINSAKAGEKIELDAITNTLIDYAYTYYFKLKTLFGVEVFDISVYPLVELWGFSPDKIESENKTPPKEADIENTKALVGLERTFSYDREKRTLTKLIDGAKIDLGGLAKGYIADETKKIFERFGVKSGIADIGGNLYLYGDRTFRVGIKNPRKGEHDDYIKEIITVENTSVVTSGDYERYYIDSTSGKRYHHIIDPKSGMPSESGLISVTVVAESSVVADILTTSLMILGETNAMRLLSGEDIERVIFMSEDEHSNVNVTMYTKQDMIENN